MQNVTANYVQASSGAGGAWAEPSLFADWQQDGYLAADGTTLAVIDTFARVVNDGLGVSDSGHSYINVNGSAADYDVDGAYAVHSVTTNGTARHSVVAGVSMLTADQTIGVLGPLPTGDSVEAGVLFARYIDDLNHYRFGIIIDPDATVHALVVRAIGGVEVVIASVIVPGLQFTPSEELLVNGHITPDNVLQTRVWRSGLPPPMVWHAEVQDNAISSPGMVGFRSAVYPANTNVKPVQFRYSSYRAINGAIDDLRKQVGGWTVTHHLDDGYPDSVAFVSGIGVPTLSAEMTAPPTYHTNVPMQVTEYYSPFNEQSPVYGFDRDLAPVKLDHGVVTAAGPEQVRIFTGQMQDIPARQGQATLAATSANRLKLTKLVQPPAAYGAYQGANGTWPVSYALAACGVYASPPPQEGCRLWVPLHGSSRAFIPSDNGPAANLYVYTGSWLGTGSTNVVAGPSRTRPVTWTDGPFVSALDAKRTGDYAQTMVGSGTGDAGVRFAAGADILSSTAVCKVEMYVRGDAFNLNEVPPTSGSIATLNRFRVTNTNGTYVDLWIRTDDRRLQLVVNDGVNLRTVATTAIPTDNAWHFIGGAWNIATSKLWVNLDGVVTTGSLSIVAANFPAADDPSSSRELRARLPTAEIQVTTGAATANPDTVGWLNTIPWTQGAQITPSHIELASVAEPQAVEAWQYVSSFAQAELASLRCDENDIVTYLGPGWWVKDAQQVVAETYSTEYNSASVDLNIDPSKVRNQIQVSFNEARNVDQYTLVFTVRDVITLPPGITVLTCAFTSVAVEVRSFAFSNVAAVDTVQPTTTNFISVNTQSDGAGVYLPSSQVAATVLSWDPGQAVVQIDNPFANAVYLANDKNWSTLAIAAKSVDTVQATVLDSDTTSATVRGERGLSVNAPVLQSRSDARRLARRLKMALRKPVPAADELTLFGDARRQPGDLVTFEDPTVTKVSGRWRVQSVTHEYEQGEGTVDYTNKVIVRPAKPIMVIGQGRVGESLIGPTT